MKKRQTAATKETAEVIEAVEVAEAATVSEKVEEVPKAAEVIEAAEDVRTGNVMYVGPTVQNLIRYGTVFAGGVLPQKVNAVIAEFPAAAKLFVPVEEMPQAMKNLSMRNSVLSAVSDRMARKYNKR